MGVPTARSMGSSFGDYGVGLAGGAIYALIKGFFGDGWLGSLAAPIAAGSFLKGTRGTVISVTAGFQAGQELLAGGGGINLGSLFGGGGGGSEPEVM